ncbi:probable galacturonosyltransferase 3 isoform X1 [Typha latifolia]|uniref:probable galacturonosyltransferase 3 isoform X1 n=2 Tax=Typha latifolia TaxID=4733 RepID=UPI003C2F8ED2
MASACRNFSGSSFLLLVISLQDDVFASVFFVLYLCSEAHCEEVHLIWCPDRRSFTLWILACSVRPEILDTIPSKIALGAATSQKDVNGYRQMPNCPGCGDGKGREELSEPGLESQEEIISRKKLQRLKLRQVRRKERALKLIQMSENAEVQMREAAIEWSNNFNSSIRPQYSIWRREHDNFRADSTLKLMNDQIIMAKVYASIARSRKLPDLADHLMKQIKESESVIKEANSDSELQQGALQCAKAMGQALSMAKDKLYDCVVIARKLRAMVQSAEETITAQKKKSMFLMQYASKTIPKPLHCLPLLLTTDYFLQGHSSKALADKRKLEDPSFYHYAIFSDNVLATSVVVNSTIVNAKKPEKHVFHIVTDRLNFAAMKMWFIVHSPPNTTIDVQNVDDFKWLNASYCPVLSQTDSANLKDYYFAVNHPSTVSIGDEHLKYRNPKYLSLLNHLRFYMPELYPKLDKILFLDDDIVVQRDLTPLWSINLKGMVNGAVETCGKTFHRFHTYLNFSDPIISDNFDPEGCAWAFGMNLFDLKEWKKKNITSIYHYWQEQNKDRKLWKLGSLPAGLLAFYNLTYALDRHWHVLALGYKPKIRLSEIEKAAVIHYNGNYKPWLDLAIMEYKGYWSKYVKFDSPYFHTCNIHL